jgi:hypothetical protein
MALFTSGKTQCSICRNVIASCDEVIAFPPFLKNTLQLAKFSDAVFHWRCLEECPEKETVLQLLSRFREIMSSRPTNLSMEEDEMWVRQAMQRFEESP